MNSTQWFLLTIQFLASISVMGFLAIQLVKRSEERKKFRLYAIRDKWLFLAATGAISQQDYVFKTFYRSMTGGITEMKRLTFNSWVQATIRAKSALEREEHDKLVKAIDQAKPEAKEVIVEYVAAMMQILLSSSIELRVFLHCYHIFKIRLILGKL